jgi:diguanylate cyclase (GGDEF)-like protein
MTPDRSRAGPVSHPSSRLELWLGESPLTWGVLVLLLLLPLLGSVALLGLAAGALEPEPRLLRGVGASLLAGSLTLFLVVAWLLRGLNRQLSRMRSLAVTDLLTGVANRRLLVRSLERELDLARRHGFPTSVALLDIDHLERVNQEYGFAVGDQVIAQVAQRLSEHLRDSDLLARSGGGELAVLLSHLGPEQGVAAARRFRTVLTWQPLVVGGRELAVTASFGVASYQGEKDVDVEVLMSRAEAAVARAKAEGRDRVKCWEPDPAA